MSKLGKATVIQGSALALDIEDSTIDLIVTSPPYFGLRNYQDKGERLADQVGAEATPAEYIDSLVAATKEMIRVLKPSGSIWVNLGDKYASSGGHGAGSTSQRATRSQYVEQIGRSERNTTGIAQKSLIGLPWRYALRCIDELGLILRAEVIWSKPNGLPESVTDRVRRSHEQWFHFVVQPRYFSAVDEIRESYAPGTAERYASGYKAEGYALKAQVAVGSVRHDNGGPSDTNPLGKLPGSVWTIASQPFKVPPELKLEHYAAFPMEWPRRIIKGFSPAGICVACSEGRRPIIKATSMVIKPSERRLAAQITGNAERTSTSGTMLAPASREITGYSCKCPDTSAPTRRTIVLDPFGGTGTTALVAKALGRHGITVDLSADYCLLAGWRTHDRAQLIKATG